MKMQIPNLMQWLNNGGVLKIQGKDVGKVWVGIGDPGGGTGESTVQSCEEAFEWAEEKAKKSIEAQRELLALYKSGQIAWPEDGVLKLPGLGVVHRDDDDA